MQSATLVVLVCLFAVVVARTQYERYPAEELVAIPDDAVVQDYEVPVHERSPRTKRGLLLLKKKLLLGALGLKAAKVGAVGAAGVAGALALKKAKSVSVPVKVHIPHSYSGYKSHTPSYNVEVHSWSG